MFSNIGLKKLLSHSEFVFNFLFSFNKMGPNGAVSHEVVITHGIDLLCGHFVFALFFLGIHNVFFY